MKGVTFGAHRSTDYGLVLSKKNIESPSPKLETVEIPGADGLLDMTDYFGDVKYENRQLSFEFSTAVRGKGLSELYSRVQNDLNGRRFESIILDDDPDYHYIGRVTSVKLTEGKISRITVICSCEPYKVKNINKTVRVKLNSLPFGSGYGDCNGDGVIDQLDSEYLTRIVEIGTPSPYHLPSCDLNFDGTVDLKDIALLNSFLGQTDITDIRSFAETQGVYRNTEITVDFGRRITEVSFTVNFDGGNAKPWYVYVDGELCLTSTEHISVLALNGVRRISFRTPKKGEILVKYSESEL